MTTRKKAKKVGVFFMGDLKEIRCRETRVSVQYGLLAVLSNEYF
jgi:hypothetical protein